MEVKQSAPKPSAARSPPPKRQVSKLGCQVCIRVHETPDGYYLTSRFGKNLHVDADQRILTNYDDETAGPYVLDYMRYIGVLCKYSLTRIMSPLQKPVFKAIYKTYKDQINEVYLLPIEAPKVKDQMVGLLLDLMQLHIKKQGVSLSEKRSKIPLHRDVSREP